MLISVIPSKGQIVQAARNIELVEKHTKSTSKGKKVTWVTTRIKKGQRLKIVGGFRLLEKSGVLFLQVRDEDKEYTLGKDSKRRHIELKISFFNANFFVNQRLKSNEDLVYKEDEELESHRFSGLEL